MPRRLPRLLAAAAVLAVLAWACAVTYRHLRQARLDADLVAAAEANDLARAQVLLDRGADPNARPAGAASSAWQRMLDAVLGRRRPAGPPVLALAVGDEHWPLAEGLVRRGADPNVRAPNPLGDEDPADTVLCKAAWFGQTSMVRALLGHGADPNAAGHAGRRPLHLAVERSYRPELTNLLLDSGARVDAVDGEGVTPLMRAAEWRKVSAVSVLLARGASVTVRDHSGRTVLHHAVNRRFFGLPPGSRWLDHQSCRILRLLLQRGADPTVRDEAGATPHDWAAEAQDLLEGSARILHRPTLR